MLRDCLIVIVLAFSWAYVVACPAEVKPDPIPPPPPAPSPEPLPKPVPAADGCTLACTRLLGLGCLGAQGSPGPDDVYGTPDDVACADACRGIERTGITTLATDCIQRAGSCAAVDKCMEGSE